jgi:hypothetical protein
MNREFDELLRDGMERFTAELRAPANLAARARRNRRQRLTVRTAASGVAAMTAAGITFAVIPATTAPVSIGGLDLHPAAERFDIEHAQATGVKQTSDQVWVYRQQNRELRTASPGRPIQDEGSAVVKAKHGHDRGVRTIVNYHRKVWARGPGGASFITGTLSCHLPDAFLPGSPEALPGWIRGVRKLIKCGDLVISGTAQINGIQTIKLKTSASYTEPPVKHATIWVKRSDYAPVRLVERLFTNTIRTDVSWLPPTKSNLAMLRVPIPPGFRKVPFSQLADVSSGSCHVSSSHLHKQACTHSG